MKYLIVVLAVIVIMLLATWPFMWVWNYAIVSAVSVAKPIDYWVAFWLMGFLSSFVANSRSSK